MAVSKNQIFWPEIFQIGQIHVFEGCALKGQMTMKICLNVDLITFSGFSRPFEPDLVGFRNQKFAESGF